MNVLGTVNVLAAVRNEAPAARIVVASSGEVYGRADTIPTPEHAALAPLSPYAASKAAAEIACAQAVRADGLDVVVVRAFPLVGPGQEKRSLSARGCSQIAAPRGSRAAACCESATSSVRRDLTDVRDASAAYGSCSTRHVPAGTYNLASGTAVALGEVVELLRGLARDRDRGRAGPCALRPADIEILAGDWSALRGATGWEPTTALEESLADALDEARMGGKRGMNVGSWRSAER